jgi:hypothetical protein
MPGKKLDSCGISTTKIAERNNTAFVQSMLRRIFASKEEEVTRSGKISYN